MSPRAAFRCAEGWFQVSLWSIGRGKRLLARRRMYRPLARWKLSVGRWALKTDYHLKPRRVVL